jgi:hypothetical protein
LRFAEFAQWFLPAFAGLLALALVLVVLRKEYRAKPPILVQTAAGRLLPLGSPGAPTSLWRARIMGTPSGPGSSDGILVIAGGNLAFVEEGEREPRWRFPAADVEVTQRGPERRRSADLELQLPDARRLEVIVSKTRISRHLNSGLSALAQGDHAHVFTSILAANGATCRRQ